MTGCSGLPNRYIDCSDEHWDENASFIAHARHEIPRLIAEIRPLKAGRRADSADAS